MTNPTELIPTGGALTQEQAIVILNNLINKPDVQAVDIPQIFQNIVGVYNTAFAPIPVPVKKKRRRTASLSPNLGWPAGVSRAEYTEWKNAQLAAGVTEGLNPQEYKRQKDGTATSAVPKADPVPEVANEPVAAAKGAKRTADKQAKEAGIDTSNQTPVTAGQPKKGAKAGK